MPKISKNKLNKKTYDLILSHLVYTLTILRNEKEVSDLIDNLFTGTERLMLAKRLAIAALLEQEFSYQKISELLKVSSVTIGFVRNSIMKNNENYTKLIRSLIGIKNLKLEFKS